MGREETLNSTVAITWNSLAPPKSSWCIYRTFIFDCAVSLLWPEVHTYPLYMMALCGIYKGRGGCLRVQPTAPRAAWPDPFDSVCLARACMNVGEKSANEWSLKVELGV